MGRQHPVVALQQTATDYAMLYPEQWRGAEADVSWNPELGKWAITLDFLPTDRARDNSVMMFHCVDLTDAVVALTARLREEDPLCL